MSLDVEYYSFNHVKADKKWDIFFNFHIKKKLSDLSDEEQEFMECLENKNSIDEDEFINNIKILDLKYGTTFCVDIEESKIEFLFIKAIMEVFNFSEKNSYPIREEWISFFEKLDKQKFSEICDSVMRELDWSKEEAEQVLVNYLGSVKPLVSKLKKENKAIFISRYLGDFGFDPKKSEIFMKNRAKNILDKYI